MVKRNNPFNIRFNKANNWRGQTGSENGFCVFSSEDYGIRAACKLLYRYITIYHLTKPRDIIARWAPACENNLDNYYFFVSGYVDIDEEITPDVLQSSLTRLAFAMYHFESGIVPIAEVREKIISQFHYLIYHG